MSDKDAKQKLNNKQATGHITAVPLSVQDKDTKRLIKVSTLFVHTIGDESTSTTQRFGKIYVTAVHQEGRFHSVITKENCLCLMKRGDFSAEEWEAKIAALFPSTVSLGQNKSTARDLQLAAKLFSLEEYYDSQTKELVDTEDMSSLSDYITIDIKTKDQLPVTLGSLDLYYADESDKLGSNELLQKELDLFLWLGILSQERDTAITRLAEAEEEIESLSKQNSLYKTEVEESSRSHRELVVDLQDKFFQLLNAKKDKIWDLERNNGLKGSLHTNDICVKQENEPNMKNLLVDIPLEEGMPSAKRRKKNIHDEDHLNAETISPVNEIYLNNLGRLLNDTQNQLDRSNVVPSDVTRPSLDEPANHVSTRSQARLNEGDGHIFGASDTEISSDENSTVPEKTGADRNDDKSDQSTYYSGEDERTDADSPVCPKKIIASTTLNPPEINNNNFSTPTNVNSSNEVIEDSLPSFNTSSKSL